MALFPSSYVVTAMPKQPQTDKPRILMYRGFLYKKRIITNLQCDKVVYSRYSLVYIIITGTGVKYLLFKSLFPHFLIQSTQTDKHDGFYAENTNYMVII